MKWIYSIAPKALKRLDNHLRVNYVWIWATRAHLAIYLALVLSLFFCVIGLLIPMDIQQLMQVKDILNFFFPLLIPAYLLMGYYLFQLVLFNVDKKFARNKSWYIIPIFLLTNLSLLSPFLIPVGMSVVLNHKISSVVTDEEFIEDRNHLLKACFFSYNREYDFGYYVDDQEYLSQNNYTTFRPRIYVEEESYEDKYKIVLRDSIFYHKGIFTHQRPKLYRLANEESRSFILDKEFEVKGAKNRITQESTPVLPHYILDSLNILFYKSLNTNYDLDTAQFYLGKLNQHIQKYTKFDVVNVDKIIADHQANRYQNYTLNSLRNYKLIGTDYSYDSYDYTEVVSRHSPYYKPHKYIPELIKKRLKNIATAKNNFFPNSSGTFLKVMFYVTFFLSVLIVLFKMVHWKQFLLIFLLTGILLAVIGVFEGVFRLRGFSLNNITLVIMLLSYLKLFTTYKAGNYFWLNNQLVIFAFLFMPFTFLFLLSYLANVLNFWDWEYFLINYRELSRDGTHLEYTPAYYALKDRVYFWSFHGGLFFFVVLLPGLHKTFIRLQALPKAK